MTTTLESRIASAAQDDTLATVERAEALAARIRTMAATIRSCIAEYNMLKNTLAKRRAWAVYCKAHNLSVTHEGQDLTSTA